MKKRWFLTLILTLLLMAGQAQAALPVTSGLVTHLDAGTITGVADGGAVATWDDLSGLNYDATQVTAGAQPTYVASNAAFNGLATVSFDGTDDTMSMGLGSVGFVPANSTVFVLGNYDDIVGWHAMINNSSGGRIKLYLDKTPGYWTWVAGNNKYSDIRSTDLGISVDTAAHIFGMVADNNAATPYVEGFLDGVHVDTSTTLATGHTDPMVGLNLGWAAAAGSFLRGDVAELIIYNRPLTTTEFQRVNDYLVAKMSSVVSGPDPADNETRVEIDLASRFVPGKVSWNAPGSYPAGTTYDVYFGTTEPNLSNPAPYGLTQIGTAGQTVTSAAPTLPLNYETTYYWVVDTYEPNLVAPYVPTFHQGIAWSFTTIPADFSPQVDAGVNYITWLANLPQYITGSVDDNGEGDISNADVVWSIIDSPGIADATAMQMLTRNDAATLALMTEPNLVRDWIGTDARVGNDPMVLTLSGLPAGSYTWTSTHHDINDQTGQFDVYVNGALVDTGIDISNGSITPATYTRTITSDGTNPVKLVFRMQDWGSANSKAFFAMNGFVLTNGVDTLKVDFTDAANVSYVQAGYQGYFATHETAVSFTPQNFAMGTATVTVLPQWGLEPAGLINATVTKTSTDPLIPAADFTTDVAGDYTIQLTATDGAAQSGSNTLVVRVAADACAAAQLVNGFVFNIYDVDENCVVNLPDLAAFALQWLDDANLTESAVY